MTQDANELDTTGLDVDDLPDINQYEEEDLDDTFDGFDDDDFDEDDNIFDEVFDDAMFDETDDDEEDDW